MPKTSPKSSDSIPGGEAGASASSAPRPNIVVTTTATAASRLTPATLAASAIATAARTIAGAAPKSSGTPAIEARTRPGKSEWESDSAA